MRVAMMNTKPTYRANYLMKCFEEGIRRLGDETVWVDDYRDFRRHLENCDVGVQVCFANRWHNNSDLGKFRLEVAHVMERLGKRILTVDTGFVNNQTDFELRLGSNKQRVYFAQTAQAGEFEGRVHYEVGYDGLKRNAAYHNEQVSSDRWQALGVELKPWRERGDHILILGQTFHGLSSQHAHIYEWYAEVIRQIRARTDRRILFRQHPRMTKLRSQSESRQSNVGLQTKAKKDRDSIKRYLGKIRHFEWSTTDLVEDDLKNCWAAVAFTTNAAVSAIINGIPVFAGDPGCIVWDVANHKLKRIEAPLMPDRTQWANRVAYAQWTSLEMKLGQSWAHLRPHARKPPGSGRWSVT